MVAQCRVETFGLSRCLLLPKSRFKIRKVRVKFRKGMQRKFLESAVDKLNSPSLRRLTQYGLKINYQTLKSYFNENRTLPEDLFLDICTLLKINPKSIKVFYLKEHWGQIKGGKK